ncbi:hypothetical protein AB0G06_40830 [Nonomuraea dietziae]|uniref:ATP-dependent DNA ligase n=1 Tax=Nonomuraea dietziae TaxID=65515 RepID=UPI0033D289E8
MGRPPEIVRWSGRRLDFAASQRRQAAGHGGAAVLARSEVCHYVVFDVLKLRGRNVMGQPLSERRALLEELFAPLPVAGALALSMHTRDEAEARVWYETMHVAGVEGPGDQTGPLAL